MRIETKKVNKNQEYKSCDRFVVVHTYEDTWVLSSAIKKQLRIDGVDLKLCKC